MKILIVDDESIVRIGMRHIVPWKDYGYEVVGEASNGEEALSLAIKMRPDIVLIDIVMPNMDGLNCIEKIKCELPFTKFIILSCRDDAAFYRKAIKLGVSEYIQKSLASPDEILEAVNRISEEIRSSRLLNSSRMNDQGLSQEQVSMGEFFNMVMKGQITDPVTIINSLHSYGIEAANKAIYIISFTVDFMGNMERKYDGGYDASLISVAQGIINETAQGCIFSDYTHSIMAVVFCPAESCEHEQIQNLFYRIQETLAQLFYIRLTAGVSSRILGCTAVKEGLSQSLISLDNIFIKGRGNIYFYNDARDKKEALSKLAKEKESILKIDSPIEADAYLDIFEDMESIILQYEGIPSSFIRTMYMDILYHIINLLRNDGLDIEDIMGENFNPIAYIEEPETIHMLNINIKRLLNNIRAYYSSKLRGNESDIIAAIQKYINDHIGDKISLDDIASMVHMSTSYTSRFYKKVTGVNLQKYIVWAKIEKAKEMIRLNCSLKETIDHVGFSSESHFFKVFKTVTGLSPKQYRHKIVEK